MEVIIKPELKQIKNGWSATTDSLGVGLTAHGYSQEVAKANLERTIRLFLAPADRVGNLELELNRIGIAFRNEKEGLNIYLEGTSW